MWPDARSSARKHRFWRGFFRQTFLMRDQNHMACGRRREPYHLVSVAFKGRIHIKLKGNCFNRNSKCFNTKLNFCLKVTLTAWVPVCDQLRFNPSPTCLGLDQHLLQYRVMIFSSNEYVWVPMLGWFSIIGGRFWLIWKYYGSLAYFKQLEGTDG
jgi:hypothetical protein